LNELVIFVIFRRCCSAGNLWGMGLTLSCLSIIEGADILHELHGSNIGGASPSGPMKSASLKRWN